MAAARPPLALRILGAVMPAAVTAAIGILAAAMFASGALMWRDWHALAHDGVDHQARVERCEWEGLFRQKYLISRSGSGYYSCHYAYRVAETGPTHTGYFQSPREWKAGEPIAIRYRRDEPGTSATTTNLQHPSMVPGALMALPLLFAGWQLRVSLARRWRALRAR